MNCFFLNVIIISAMCSSIYSGQFTLQSPAFITGSTIPSKFTGDGINVSPELSWKNVPAGTVSLALIVDDPDAPGGTFVHWIVYNIPVGLKKLKENVSTRVLATGQNSLFYARFGEWVYAGPFPPLGETHHYHFKLYALDSFLPRVQDIDEAGLIAAMAGHVLGFSELVPVYTRTGIVQPLIAVNNLYPC